MTDIIDILRMAVLIVMSMAPVSNGNTPLFVDLKPFLAGFCVEGLRFDRANRTQFLLPPIVGI